MNKEHWFIFVVLGAGITVASVVLLLYGLFRYNAISNEYWIIKATNAALTSQHAQSMIDEMMGAWERLPYLTVTGFAGGILALVGWIKSD